MKGRCRLFDKETILQNSHIYPSFVIDYFKKTGSKYLRQFNNPNLRKQDGLKQYLLSIEAEQRFSTSEKWFSENIFIPYLDNKTTSFNYNENLYYFSISFLWRILILHTDFSPELKNHWCYQKLLEIEDEWRRFLANYNYPEKFNNIQLFFTDRIKETTFEVQGLDYYTSRALDGTIITSNDKKYIAVFGKFLRFIFWCVISTDHTYTNNDTAINPIKGSLKIPQNFKDDYLIGFLVNRSNQIENLEKASEKQQEIIKNEILKNKEAF